MARSIVLFSFVFLLNAVIYSSAHSVTSASPKQKINLYYESLCPGCQAFITQQLCPALKSMGEYYEVEFIPYGNAKTIVSNETGKITITCQHGDEECFFNQVHACAIKHLSYAQSTAFICCLEANNQAGDKCAKEVGFDPHLFQGCFIGKQKEGLELLYQYGLKTAKLVPPHEFVPWVLIDGKYDKREMNEALDDLMMVLCRHIKDPKPEVCNEIF